jgi:hypothetical protein
LLNQMRRNDSGGLKPGGQCTLRAQLSVPQGRGTTTASAYEPLVRCKGKTQPALGLLQLLDADRRQLQMAQRASEAGENQRAIAGRWGFGRQDLPDAGGRRDHLARSLTLPRGLAADAGQRLGHGDIVGRDRAAGGAVQIANCGVAQFQGFGGKAAAARKAATSAPEPGGGGKFLFVHQSHQARTATR